MDIIALRPKLAVQLGVQIFWQMAHTNYGKRSLRHLGPTIWDKIDPSLHDSSQLTFKKQYTDILISAYDDR